MKRIALIIVAIAFVCTNVYAADQKAAAAKTAAPTTNKAVAKPAATPAPAAPAKAAAAEPQKKMTKAEMITRINELLKNRPNVAPMIQGLEQVKQEGGASYYLYNKKKLEDLDEDTLLKLLSMINQQISIENLQQFDRQQRQLKNLQQIEQINKTQRMLNQSNTPSAPKVYTPPKVPKTYK